MAVIGRTGSGKSTLGQLLVRMYDPDEGEILIDGVNIVFKPTCIAQAGWLCFRMYFCFQIRFLTISDLE